MNKVLATLGLSLLLSTSLYAQEALEYSEPQPEAYVDLPEQPAPQQQPAVQSKPQLGQQPNTPSYGQLDQSRFQADEEEEPRQPSNLPIIGAKKLLNSLADLDRPLTPEDVTAYGAVLQNTMPMSPEMIRDYRRRIDESQRAAAMPPSGMRAKPITDSIRMSLKAEQKLQTLYTTPSTVSVMAFYDRSGKAWPIASFVVGRADSFQVYALQEGSNQIAVTPLVAHGYSNLIISLVEEDRPIVINLETNDHKTHFRRDITIEAYGPNAVISPTTTADKTPPSDNVMMAFAQGADLPEGSMSLQASDPDVEAWSYKGDLYLRTTNTLMSPSWSSSLTGPGAVHAYRLKPSPIVLISRNGSVSRVRISQ